MTQPETRIVRDIRRALAAKYQRCWTVKIHGGMYQAAGIPDIIGVIDGMPIAIEVKVPGEVATRLQALTIRRILEAGGIAGVATSVEEAVALIDGGRTYRTGD